MSKKISEMSDAELLGEIERMRAVPVPNAPSGRTKRPKRIDEHEPSKKRKSIFDQLED